MSEYIKQKALDYHAFPKPGKISIEISTEAESQEDLSLAYSPGVAEPVRRIHKNPDEVYRYTAKGNLVAVITNGTAILGLGDLGPMPSKPVMEGKCLLFKRFADIDAIDIEVDERNVDLFVETVKRIACTFGGINLEDIKAPECFAIERSLSELCDIPVFHDDQHGTAIVTAAGLLNALEIQGKQIEDAKIVCLGAGAAGIACMRLLVSCGAKKENIYMIDRMGVIYKGRDNVNSFKKEFEVDTEKRTLSDACVDADVFIGLSGPDIFLPEMLASMSENPIVFACSNPDPEIDPAVAKLVRDDLIIATGRSDYPNQVNNVLGFPYIFRGALDVRAKAINEPMKIAAVYALRKLAQLPVTEEVLSASTENSLVYGREYILPKPFDSRLMSEVSKAVALAAIETGVARIDLPEKYTEK
jgi:malate dehydrogenase (oxaloacetate-decarboxylating)(NADP+)